MVLVFVLQMLPLLSHLSEVVRLHQCQEGMGGSKFCVFDLRLISQ